MKPQRIQLSRKAGWRMPENTVVVSRHRGSPDWGNPFRIGVDGDAQQCVDKFRAMWMKSTPEEIHTMTAPLRGKNLACWCRPGSPCHADVLLEIANA